MVQWPFNDGKNIVSGFHPRNTAYGMTKPPWKRKPFIRLGRIGASTKFYFALSSGPFSCDAPIPSAGG
ncbi:hypothetical protein EMIT0324P_160067 [Pseudomonas chlororaphis]